MTSFTNEGWSTIRPIHEFALCPKMLAGIFAKRSKDDWEAFEQTLEVRK